MAKNSKIEWTDHTVNLWWGCSKVHTGCKNCYAETLSNRFGGGIWGVHTKRTRIKSAFSDLAKYQSKAHKEGIMVKVFVGSMMDIFEPSKDLNNPIPTDGINTTGDLRDKLFEEIRQGLYPNIVFLFLTKRPENINVLLPSELRYFKNLWFGTSVSDVKTMDCAYDLCSQTVENRFLSIEPQVSFIDRVWFSKIMYSIHWVIQGGESGANKRPFLTEWAYEIRDMCRDSNTPYFFKQIDKIKEIPEDLMVRQFPVFDK